MKAFISYSHHDAALLERLHVHFATLRKEGLLQAWFDRDILAGEPLGERISNELAGSDLFLAMVSPDFLNSSYCVDREMEVALRRFREGAMQIVPIVAEP